MRKINVLAQLYDEYRGTDELINQFIVSEIKRTGNTIRKSCTTP